LIDRVPATVRTRLDEGVAGVIGETPKPGDAAFRRAQNLIVGSNRLAVDAAAAKARALGYRPLVLSTFVEGETREIARMHTAIAREVCAANRPVRAPACLISGGETTVTIRGKGLGGRNQEFVLAAASPFSLPVRMERMDPPMPLARSPMAPRWRAPRSANLMRGPCSTTTIPTASSIRSMI
jgi:glycerate 2-kinase